MICIMQNKHSIPTMHETKKLINKNISGKQALQKLTIDEFW